MYVYYKNLRPCATISGYKLNKNQNQNQHTGHSKLKFVNLNDVQVISWN